MQKLAEVTQVKYFCPLGHKKSACFSEEFAFFVNNLLDAQL